MPARIGASGRALHHIDLWVDSLAEDGPLWSWLLASLGWTDFQQWGAGRSWIHPDGTYLGIEESPELRPGGHDRHRAGLNHLAFTVGSREALDQIREAAPGAGWRELFGERYPLAGGPDHLALYLENGAGFEVEIVVQDDPSD